MIGAVFFSQIMGAFLLQAVATLPLPNAGKGAIAPLGVVSRAEAITTLPMLFSTDDYPIDAFRKGEVGTSAVSLVIDGNGRASKCTIESSSGSTSLDQTTCTIIQARGRFRPARDAAGRPVEDNQTARVRWQLPTPEPFVDGRSLLILTIDAEGLVTKCRRVVPTEYLDADACPVLIGTTILTNAGEPLTMTSTGQELVYEAGMFIGQSEGSRNVGRGKGEVLNVIDAIALDVDAGGAVTGCQLVEGRLTRPHRNEPCDGSEWIRFTALDRAESNQTERHVVKYWATYTRPIR